MFFRATLFSTFGGAKRWLAQQPDGSVRPLRALDYYAAGAITGFAASFAEGPIDLFKSQVQVQIIRSRTNPDYKREPLSCITPRNGCGLQVVPSINVGGPFIGPPLKPFANMPCACMQIHRLFEVLPCKFAGCQLCYDGSIISEVEGHLGGNIQAMFGTAQCVCCIRFALRQIVD